MENEMILMPVADFRLMLSDILKEFKEEIRTHKDDSEWLTLDEIGGILSCTPATVSKKIAAAGLQAFTKYKGRRLAIQRKHIQEISVQTSSK